jgi:hypothetical protein
MASILQRPEFSCAQERLLQNKNSCLFFKFSAVEQSISEVKIKDSYLKYTSDTLYHL